jgi:hypothetical protein
VSAASKAAVVRRDRSENFGRGQLVMLLLEPCVIFLLGMFAFPVAQRAFRRWSPISLAICL